MKHRKRQELIENIQLAGLVLAALILTVIAGVFNYQKQQSKLDKQNTIHQEQEKHNVHSTRPKG